MISGGASWDSQTPGGNEELWIQELTVDHEAQSVSVMGGNDSGVDRVLVAEAYCLVPLE